jgi:hypothetical protein
MYIPKVNEKIDKDFRVEDDEQSETVEPDVDSYNLALKVRKWILETLNKVGHLDLIREVSYDRINRTIEESGARNWNELLNTDLYEKMIMKILGDQDERETYEFGTDNGLKTGDIFTRIGDNLMFTNDFMRYIGHVIQEG